MSFEIIGRRRKEAEFGERVGDERGEGEGGEGVRGGRGQGGRLRDVLHRSAGSGRFESVR